MADRGGDSLVERVRSTVNTIPVGRVASSGDIGDHLGVGARRIGRMMSVLEDDIAWWRVVCADRSPAVCHGGTAPGILEAEGTPIRDHRVDMDRARHSFK